MGLTFACFTFSQVLTIIHLDEVTHVSAGHRWLTYLCARAKPAPRDPVQVFREEVRANFVGKLKGVRVHF